MVIKAEDARMLQHMPTMKRMYGDLYSLNRELLGEVQLVEKEMEESDCHTIKYVRM